MKRKEYVGIVAASTCLILLFVTSCGISSSRPAPIMAAMATSGTGQTATAGKAFAAPLVARVTTGGVPTRGVQVTFTAPSSGASGTFANGTWTEIDSTDSSGVATSSVFTANQMAGTYTVIAVAKGASALASFTMTNEPESTTVTNYSFYLSGLADSANYYALAGSVAIDINGNVVSGEQDYNDAEGCTSPEPNGDTISGGTLTVDASTGQGTLTLITNDPILGVSGTETLGVQFVNKNHALIIEFDGSASSSGSMDMQTLPSTLSGGYAFTLSGMDPTYIPIAFGGVFTISGASLQNGVVDVNDGGAARGTVVTGTPFNGTLSTPDSFGRGTLTGTGIADTIVYYVVGPETIRMIGVDATDSVVGSAFGQGSSIFTNASLGSSVFIVEPEPAGLEYALAGMLTVPASGTFQGVADIDELGMVWPGDSIAGTYSISENVSGFTYNGYGSLSMPPRQPLWFTSLGLYMTDPSLNLNDPNSTTGGGGALILELDPFFVGGVGVVTPQTDPATASFAGNYAFGAQDFYTGSPSWEFDFVGQGAVNSGVLNGAGFVNDSDAFFGENSELYSGVPFSGTAAPDPGNAGRYTIPLTIAVPGSPATLQVVIYQASGGQLFWVDEDNPDYTTYLNDQIFLDVFSGSLQQQGSLAGLPAARRSAAKNRVKHKH